MSDINETLTERRQTHGDYRDVALTAQATKTLWRSAKGWERLTFRQRESLEMMANKVGRILSGDPGFADHWLDVAGYAQLIVDQIEGGNS